MLDLGRIPVKTEERTEKDPFIIVGGPCVYNPEPLADFFDLAVVGEGEEAVSYTHLEKPAQRRQDFY